VVFQLFYCPNKTRVWEIFVRTLVLPVGSRWRKRNGIKHGQSDVSLVEDKITVKFINAYLIVKYLLYLGLGLLFPGNRCYEIVHFSPSLLTGLRRKMAICSCM
jgi:hypothetical protein